jgi:hypothetical protein
VLTSYGFRPARAGGKLRAAVEKVNGTSTKAEPNADQAVEMPEKARRETPGKPSLSSLIHRVANVILVGRHGGPANRSFS